MVTKSLENKANGQTKLAYQCQVCGICFCLLDGTLICPGCGSRDLNQMVVIYKESDSELGEYTTELDISAGD